MQKDPGFAKLVFGNGNDVVREDGAYVIRKNIKQLDHILIFLEKGTLPENRATRSQMYSDAQALNVTTLQRFLTRFTQSGILNGKDPLKDILLTWIHGRQGHVLPYLLYYGKGWM